MVEWTTPSGHTYTVDAEPVPSTTWWPSQTSDLCPCEVCDRPRITDTDIADALPEGEDPETLSDAELLHLASALPG